MEELTVFHQLKNDVLLTYQKHYPFFKGNWKTFSSNDIQNLIDLISKEVKQSISEKWIYTHLKPEQNDKLPRKDMLDILSQFVGFSGWDEYVFTHKKEVVAVDENSIPTKKKYSLWLFLGLILLIAIGFYFIFKKENKTIEIQDSFTNETITNEVEAVIVKDSTEIPVDIKEEAKIEISVKDSVKIKLKSPFYKEKTVVVNAEGNQKIQLEPNDYAMILKGFMKADIKDWQTRKEQLNLILDENLEVLVMLKDNLGAEYFNKEEFAELVIVPSATLKKMKIVEIKSADNQKINFIRIIQE